MYVSITEPFSLFVYVVQTVKFTTSKPRLHEQFLCGNCIWQFLFARVDDRQIFVFKLRQAMLDGQNLGTLGTGFNRCR